MANNKYTKEDLLNLMKDVKNTFTDINAAIVDRGGESSKGGFDLPNAVSTIPKSELGDLNETIKDNGSYFFKPLDYGVDGFEAVEINVDVPGGEATIGPAEVSITENGKQTILASDYGVDGISDITIDVNVSGGEGGYSYFDGSFDEQGLRDLGWTNDDINYYKSNVPHYAWEDSIYVVSDGNKEYNYKNYPAFSSITAAMRSDITGNASFFPYVPEYLAEINNSSTEAGTFNFCKHTIAIPSYDTSNRNRFRDLFKNCEKLRCVPLLDTSNGTDFYGMFNGCKTITSIPPIDTSKGTTFDGMFQNCFSLVSVPSLDTHNGTDFGYMFSYCTAISYVPELDTSNGTYFNSMFQNCTNLSRIEGVDFSGATSALPKLMWPSNNSTLTYLRLNGTLNVSADFSYLRALDHDSYASILDAARNTTNTDSKTLTFYTRTIEDPDGLLLKYKADCENMGWQIVGLTLA